MTPNLQSDGFPAIIRFVGYDPANRLISGALILLVVGLATSWIPARHAASMQPIEAEA
jgi:ABC-type antimicrobial peptide transport system permease subunit